MANETTTSMSATVKSAYDRRLLMRALPRLLHGRWGRTATFRGFKDWEIRRWESLSAVTTALSEGVTPAENAAPNISTYTLTPEWYGAWVGYTDKLELQAFDPVISETSAILGEQAGLSIDTLIRSELTANAGSDFSGGATARNELDMANDKIAYSDIVYNVATLEAERARPADGGMYPVLMHPCETIAQNSGGG